MKMRSMWIAILVLLALGCLNDPVGISTTVGEWKLETVNGSSLPHTLSGSGNNKTELVSDVLNLYEGFTYAETVVARTTVNGQVTETSTRKAGPYSISLGALVFANNENLPNKTAKLEGNKLVFAEPEFVRVFTK